MSTQPSRDGFIREALAQVATDLQRAPPIPKQLGGYGAEVRVTIGTGTHRLHGLRHARLCGGPTARAGP